MNLSKEWLLFAKSKSFAFFSLSRKLKLAGQLLPGDSVWPANDQVSEMKRRSCMDKTNSATAGQGKFVVRSRAARKEPRAEEDDA